MLQYILTVTTQPSWYFTTDKSRTAMSDLGVFIWVVQAPTTYQHIISWTLTELPNDLIEQTVITLEELKEVILRNESRRTVYDRWLLLNDGNLWIFCVGRRFTSITQLIDNGIVLFFTFAYLKCKEMAELIIISWHLTYSYVVSCFRT